MEFFSVFLTQPRAFCGLINVTNIISQIASNETNIRLRYEKKDKIIHLQFRFLHATSQFCIDLTDKLQLASGIFQV